MTEIYIVRPPDTSEDLVAFESQEDAERYADARDLYLDDVESVVVCDRALAEKMIEEATGDE